MNGRTLKPPGASTTISDKYHGRIQGHVNRILLVVDKPEDFGLQQPQMFVLIVQLHIYVIAVVEITENLLSVDD